MLEPKELMTASGMLMSIEDDASPGILFMQNSGEGQPLTVRRDKAKDITILEYGKGEDRIMLLVIG